MLASSTLPITHATIAPETVVDLLVGAAAAFVTFRKRGDGTLREMLCSPTPSTLAPTASDMDTQTRCVWDMEKREYRSIPLDSVIAIRTVATNDLLNALR